MAAAALVLIPLAANAEVNCRDALVSDTFSKTTSDQLDWRMASQVTEKEWNEASHNGTLNVVIYGVPVGASYKDFKKNISDRSNSRQESLTTSQFDNVLWTYLDPAAAPAYTACVDAQLNSGGIHVAVKHASQSDVAVSISWTPRNTEPPRIKPTWDWVGKVNTPFPRTLSPGRIDIVIPRPAKETTLAVRWSGSGDSVVITPVIVPQILPPEMVTANTTADSGPVASGSCGDWGNWTQVCTDNEPAGWKLVSYNFSLLGDRSCSGWAHCEKIVDTPTKVCYRFQMEGHNEQCHWNSSNTGVQNSRGVLSATWLHPK
jgi:hypothetical protein